MLLVSIIIPTYNRAQLLHRAITSVLNQTYQNFEILVIDDGSKDNTQDITNSFHDKRIKYIRHEKNKGEAGARNTGIANSTAPFIAFLDDDDEWLPEKLRLQVDVLKNSQPKVGCVYTGCFVVDETTEKIVDQRTPVKRGNIYHDMFMRNFVGIPSTIILRRECFEKVGSFDENIAYGIDHDMWIRIAKEFYFDYITEPLVWYYHHENRLSNNLEVQIKGTETLLKKYGQIFALNRKNYSQHYKRLGSLYCSIGNARKGRKVLLKAIAIYPFDIRNYIHLGLSFLSINNVERIRKLWAKGIIY